MVMRVSGDTGELVAMMVVDGEATRVATECSWLKADGVEVWRMTDTCKRIWSGEGAR
jgi:hypothetical protein